MSRKGMAVLTISAIGFLVAVILLFNGIADIKSGIQNVYLGETAVETSSAYIAVEKELLYVDLAAKYAFEAAGGVIDTEYRPSSCSAIDAECEEEDSPNYISNTQEFMARFAHEFNSYLEANGISISASDYEFTLSNTGLKGICSKTIGATTEVEGLKIIEYSVSPNFRIITNTGIRGESTYSGEELMNITPSEPENKCREAGGVCQYAECNLDEMQLPIENAPCNEAGQYCCTIVRGPCTNLGGVCKHSCKESETDKGKQIDCGEDDVCCISGISEPQPLI